MIDKSRSVVIAAVLVTSAPALVSADVVLEWNKALHDILQENGAKPDHSANPGWSTRSIAMVNTAIYDVFQAVDRTHQPFLFTGHAAPNTDVDAAVHEAAYQVLKHCYPGELSSLQSVYDAKMALIPAGAAKDNGIALGNLIAQSCVINRTDDGSDKNLWEPYVIMDGPGKWRPQPGQVAWGPGWGTVAPFAAPNAATLGGFIDELPELPALTDPTYAAAYNQVKTFGDVNSAARTTQMEDTGFFWGYDRAPLGSPPALFLRSVTQIAEQIGTSEADNARLFAIASVAQADAAIAAWDAKFKYNFWRPINAIQGDRLDGTKGHDDGNPATIEDVNWTPLGGPGDNPASATDNFTPPFPAWTSGHATMGGAVYKTLELFFGNDFQAADALYDAGDLVTAQYTLLSDEFDAAGVAGMERQYSAFTQSFDEWGLGKEGMENTPESENAMSRIYLGIHWIFDQVDGTMLGNRIAGYVAENMFQPVPEPSGLALGALAILSLRRRRRNAGRPHGQPPWFASPAQ